MPSPRKHPSRYPPRFLEILKGPPIIITLPTKQMAKNLRDQLYALRESLRSHPEFDLTLLFLANTVTMSIHDKALHIERNGEPTP